MSPKSKKVLRWSAALALIACVTTAILITSASKESSSATGEIPAQSLAKNGRNLFLQPEALRVARQLGKRFGPASRSTTLLSGNFTIAGNAQPLAITRRQTETGETVELLLSNRSLTWSAEAGVKATGSAATETERLLLERLIFDSPDYFVLAQLRGASYSTVARNVRPPDAPDNYSGALWTIVRVDEPQTDEALRPKSTWRLFYINSNSGLIDRIVSRLGDQTVEAQIWSWMEASGEKVPSQITWSIDSRGVMSYQATTISHSE